MRSWIHHSTCVETDTTDTPIPTSRKALLYVQRGGRWGERVVVVRDTGERRQLVVPGAMPVALARVHVDGEPQPRWIDAIRFDPAHWGGAVDPAEELAAARSILGRMREEALVPEEAPLSTVMGVS